VPMPNSFLELPLTIILQFKELLNILKGCQKLSYSSKPKVWNSFDDVIPSDINGSADLIIFLLHLQYLIACLFINLYHNKTNYQLINQHKRRRRRRRRNSQELDAGTSFIAFTSN
jgi:hypothetical protein